VAFVASPNLKPALSNLIASWRRMIFWRSEVGAARLHFSMTSSNRSTRSSSPIPYRAIAANAEQANSAKAAGSKTTRSFLF
jgi:hypothetical protein